MTNYCRLGICSSLIALAIILCANRVAAQVDPWEFEVYPYATEGRGILELETDNAVVPNGHRQGGNGTSAGTFPSQAAWYNQYELTYGLTDRIEAALTSIWSPPPEGLRWAGSKFRLRGRLFDAGVLPVDLGWYLELEWHRSRSSTTPRGNSSSSPIIEKDLGRFSTHVNPIFEKPILAGEDKNQGFEFGYAGAVTIDGLAISRRDWSFTAAPAIDDTSAV